MAKLQVTPVAAFTEYRELNFEGLYLRHMFWNSPRANQAQITVNKAPVNIGEIVVNNWHVRDGPGENAKLVARAQGLHTDAGKWHNSFSLVFEDGSGFGGSTLEVMGVGVETGEWAIVGGTGQFAMANGVITKPKVEWLGDGHIIELKIHAFCPRLKGTTYPAVITKSELFGGSGGSLFDIKEAPMRLESITVCNGWTVDSIAFSYVDYTGQKRSAGPWGGAGGNPQPTIQLGESEFVTQVSGTVGSFEGHEVITSIKFVTNRDTYGPFGDEARGNPSPFTIPVQAGSAIVGFFARAGDYLDAIGAHVRPL